MRLQILINHHKEPIEIIRRLLDSIDRQTGIDGRGIEILICTDGEEYRLHDNAFAGLKTMIRYFVMPHRGVCATRNTLLDLSDADYLMFCDCDDMFSGTDGLKKLIDAALRNDADIVGSDYDIEHNIDGELVHCPCRRDIKRVHGKIFRRDYLIEQNIRYPDEMLFSGDMYFLYLAYHLTDRIVWLPDNFYVWKWMPESVTRGKTHYSVRTYDRFNQCYVLVIKELKRRGLTDLYYDTLAARIAGSYIDWYSDKFLSAPADISDQAKHAIIETVKEFSDEFFTIPDKIRHKVYINLLLSRRTYGPPGKYAGLDEWIKEVTQEVVNPGENM